MELCFGIFWFSIKLTLKHIKFATKIVDTCESARQYIINQHKTAIGSSLMTRNIIDKHKISVRSNQKDVFWTFTLQFIFL